MFGQEPGAERRQGVMNQHVVTKLEADDIAYYVLHTRGENPTSVLITALTKHYSESKPKKTPDVVNEFVNRLIVAIKEERYYRDVAEYERVKETMIIPPGRDKEVTLESVVNAATSSCVLGIVKKVADGD